MRITPTSLDLLPSKGLLQKNRFIFRHNQDDGCLNGRQDGGERADVALVEVEEGVGEIHDVLVGVDVGHGRGRRRRSKGGRGVVLEWRNSID